jgi:hypothetical protein
MKKYSFIDRPEHKAQLDDWAQRWIDNALNCEAMTEMDRATATTAMRGLYAAVNLESPQRQVFVSSPTVGGIVWAIASGAWWLRDHPDKQVELFGRVMSEPELMACVALAAGISTSSVIEFLETGRTDPPDATHAATSAATDAATRAAT